MIPEATSSDIMGHVIHRSSRIKPLSFAIVSSPPVRAVKEMPYGYKWKIFKGTVIIYKNRFRGKNTVLHSWQSSQIIYLYIPKSLWRVWVFLFTLFGSYLPISIIKWNKRFYAGCPLLHHYENNSVPNVLFHEIFAHGLLDFWNSQS